MKMTTLCYLEQDGKYLMLYRNKKKNDINEGKWIGVGGHVEGTESPGECLEREVMEETGLKLTSYRFRGIVTFVPEPGKAEYMCVYTADGFEGELRECNEGELKWIPKKEVETLNLWEGDRLFLPLLMKDDTPFFSMKVVYEGDKLVYAGLDGEKADPETGWRMPWGK
ncbi:MAG TPA: 8-oxo-dGTP diphosphatase [Candidatus Lachnoclostridium pullistercoris]|uniref:8-oxo-dGTP diphosphatase n=1 Tax=Candidatus Lachnoclostridium pullistercoris TaxID=2838632 RepID=A0A9D2PDF1_9FIRM|nr:8-oxo-dGTP diphosphatase [Candidatus Lachnoclostridium pullistercoris]